MENLQQLGRYLLIEKIAGGGMANVYRSKLFGVEGFVKDVAIKKILPHWSGNAEFVRMLVDEAKVLLHLTHANIVQVFELNKQEDIYYLVMEYVDGVDLRTLSQHLKETGGCLPLTLVSFITRQILGGLHFAHEKKDRAERSLSIVHRDVSPQNILISYEGEVKITDFGIAKIVGKTSETVTGTLKGKFAYMSPEQALGQKVDCRTDIFAMGILLFEMATGERCFKGDTDLETLEAVRQARVAFPQVSHERLPERLKEIILKALKKNRDERYASAADFQADLRTFENEMGLPPGGYQAGMGDLKNFLAELFADRISQKRREEEELSQKTKIYRKKGAEITRSFREKTKVLVGTGHTRILEGDEAQKTMVSVVRTLIWDNMRTVIDAVPKAVVDGITAVKQRGIRVATGASPTGVRRWPFWIGGAVVLAAVSFYLVTFIPSKAVMPPGLPVPPSPVVVEPVLSPVSTTLGQKLMTGYLLPKVPIIPDVPVIPEVPVIETPAPKEPVIYGGLMVGAKPWGRVFVPGVISGSETPFSRKNIPVGEYTLRVIFPPQNKTVSTKISIRENSLVRCQASFGDRPGISCN